jgi:alcohol dehydrogenase class IV
MKLNYIMPTRILMGDNCLFEQRAFLATLGTKACIVTGTQSAKINGAYDDAVKALAANGQDHILYDRVMANPTDICVMEAGKLARDSGCDFVLGIGGGSPMDAAKAVAVLGRNDISKEEMYAISFTEALPLALVPTTAGTGSETTPYAVLVDTTEADGKTPKSGGPAKRSLGSPLIFPRFALLDANYMASLNRNITVNTAIDALSHAVEGMLTLRANFISNTLARESIAMIMGCMDDLLDFPADPLIFPKEKRETLLLASAIAGMVIAQSGTAAPHSMGYHFTLNWGTDHGRANGLLMKSFLCWYKEAEEAKRAADPSYPQRIPDLVNSLGMSFDAFFALVERLLGKREKASEEEIKTWSALPMKNALNTAIQPNQTEIERMFRESVG